MVSIISFCIGFLIGITVYCLWIYMKIIFKLSFHKQGEKLSDALIELAKDLQDRGD